MDAAACSSLLQGILAAMKVTKEELSKIILEEIHLMFESGEINEGVFDRLKARASGLGTKLGGAARGAVQSGLGGLASAAGEKDIASRLKARASDTRADAAYQAAGQQGASLVGGKLKKIQKLNADLVNDVKKLGLQNEEGVANSIAALGQAMRALQDNLARHLGTGTKSAPQQSQRINPVARVGKGLNPSWDELDAAAAAKEE